jgi:hypothetical protein
MRVAKPSDGRPETLSGCCTLAPSLPAIIHTNVMALIYQAELLVHGLTQITSQASRVDEQEVTEIDEQKIAEIGEEEIAEIKDKVAEHYRNALAQIESWAELIGTMAVTLRYVRTKYLHLHFGFVIESLDQRRDQRDKDEEKWDYRPEALQILQRCGFVDPSRVQSDSVFRDLNKIFIDEPGNGKSLAKDLSIMPDVASSTLFWENWVEDAIVRLHYFGKIKGPPDEPLKVPEPPSNPENSSVKSNGSRNPLLVTGVFGETEQWLWAANRCLEKLNRKVGEWQDLARTALGISSDAPKADGSVESVAEPGPSAQ